MENLALPLEPPSMNPLKSALKKIVSWLEKENVPYMVIGGIAGLVWGVRRATFDIDITLWAADREKELAERLFTEFKSRAPEPFSFVQETRVLPLRIEDANVDIVFGQLPYEEKAVRRAQNAALFEVEFSVCSPEDLILHKIISDRAKDLEDVREIVRIRREKLDRAYLDPLVRGLARDLARAEIWENYAAAFGA